MRKQAYYVDSHLHIIKVVAMALIIYDMFVTLMKKTCHFKLFLTSSTLELCRNLIFLVLMTTIFCQAV